MKRLSLAALLAPITLSPACRGPADTGDPPAPATILVSASRDTLFYAGFRDTVQLVATVSDQFGNEYTADSVAWTAPAGAALEPTGRRTARIFWPQYSLAGGISVLQVGASLGDVSVSRDIISCAAGALVVAMSGTIVRDRPVPLTARVMSLASLASYMDLPVAATWSTTDENVVALENGNAVGRSAGTATLSASACGVTDTLSVAVIAAPYTVTEVRPAGADTSHGIDLAESGLIAGRSSLAGANRNFLYDGSFTDLGDCIAVRANDPGQVLCSGDGPRIWEGGSATLRDTITGVPFVITGSGTVGMRIGSAILRWFAPGTYDTAAVSALAAYDMNEQGQFTATRPYLYPAPFVWKDGVEFSLGAAGRYAHPTAINSAGDVVVGWGESGPARPFVAQIWRETSPGTWTHGYLRGGTGADRNDLAMSAYDVSDAGDVVGAGSRGAFVWRAGRLTVLTDVVPAPWDVITAGRVNAAGQILGFARNPATGYVGAVLITPP